MLIFGQVMQSVTSSFHHVLLLLVQFDGSVEGLRTEDFKWSIQKKTGLLNWLRQCGTKDYLRLSLIYYNHESSHYNCWLNLPEGQYLQTLSLNTVLKDEKSKILPGFRLPFPQTKGNSVYHWINRNNVLVSRGFQTVFPHSSALLETILSNIRNYVLHKPKSPLKKHLFLLSMLRNSCTT